MARYSSRTPHRSRLFAQFVGLRGELGGIVAGGCKWRRALPHRQSVGCEDRRDFSKPLLRRHLLSEQHPQRPIALRPGRSPVIYLGGAFTAMGRLYYRINVTALSTCAAPASRRR